MLSGCLSQRIQHHKVLKAKANFINTSETSKQQFEWSMDRNRQRDGQTEKQTRH